MNALGVGEGLARWLAAQQRADGRIRDAATGRAAGSYAEGLAALAFGLLALRTGERCWLEACCRAARHARRRPLESEFDRFALLLLAWEASKAGEGARSLRAALPELVRPEAIRLYHGRRVVSHNWVAMRALAFSLRAAAGGSPEDVRTAGALWNRVRDWQLPCGLFVDSPGGQATPVTYHAKFCAMLALAVDEALPGAEVLRAPLERGLHVLERLTSPAGVLVPYGRSRGTLFGYAAAVLAFARGGEIFGRQRLSEIAGRLLAHLRAHQHGDGRIPAVVDGEAADRDVYVNDADYAAYAAAMLLLAGETCERAAPEPASDALTVEAIGPIVVARGGGWFAALVGPGESVPVGSPFFSDHRYYGMQPLYVERKGRALFRPAPYRWSVDRQRLADPRENPWIPYVEVGAARYCVRRYDAVRLRTDGARVTLEAEGVPERYRPLPRWERAARNCLARLTGELVPVFRAGPLPGVRLRRRLTWDATSGELRAETEALGPLPPDAALRQAAAIWQTDCEGREARAAVGAAAGVSAPSLGCGETR